MSVPSGRTLIVVQPDDSMNIIDVGKIRLMVQAIHMKQRTNARPFEWIERPDGAPEPKNLILATNGIVNAETGELIPHTGRYFATGLPE